VIVQYPIEEEKSSVGSSSLHVKHYLSFPKFLSCGLQMKFGIGITFQAPLILVSGRKRLLKSRPIFQTIGNHNCNGGKIMGFHRPYTCENNLTKNTFCF